jgi:hypothetical protein
MVVPAGMVKTSVYVKTCPKVAVSTEELLLTEGVKEGSWGWTSRENQSGKGALGADVAGSLIVLVIPNQPGKAELCIRPG